MIVGRGIEVTQVQIKDGEEKDINKFITMENVRVILYDLSNLSLPQEIVQIPIVNSIRDIDYYVYNDELYITVSSNYRGGFTFIKYNNE